MTDTPETPETPETPKTEQDFAAGIAALLDGQLPDAPAEPAPAEATDSAEDSAEEGTPGGKLSHAEVQKAWRMINQLEAAATLPLFLARSMVHALMAEETTTKAEYTDDQRAELRETRILISAVIAKRMAYGES